MTKQAPLSNEQLTSLLQLATTLAHSGSQGCGAALGCLVGILKERGTTVEQVHRFIDKVWNGLPEAIEFLEEAIESAGEFQVDLTRTDLPETGICVRATREGEWGSYDIAHLTRSSLVRFLTARVEVSLATCMHLLGHVPDEPEVDGVH